MLQNVLGSCCPRFSTTPVAERFFTSSASLTLKHAAWYPSELLDPHVVLLTSDNVIRYALFLSRSFARGDSLSARWLTAGAPLNGSQDGRRLCLVALVTSVQAGRLNALPCVPEPLPLCLGSSRPSPLLVCWHVPSQLVILEVVYHREKNTSGS